MWTSIRVLLPAVAMPAASYPLVCMALSAEAIALDVVARVGTQCIMCSNKSAP
jgi:hypothetical protein